MSALVGYGSSDEEEQDEDLGKVVAIDQQPKPVGDAVSELKEPLETASVRDVAATTEARSTPQQQQQQQQQQQSQPSIAEHSDGNTAPVAADDGAPLNGPSLGPARPPAAAMAAATSAASTTSRDVSPHTAYREAAQNLTLPTVPNFSIPPSPPGSPPPGADAKVARFLELKRQQGVHFNEKLASSSALKNPSLLGRLMRNAGMDDAEQYATVIDTELWDPNAFPDWAYKEELEKARVRADRARETAMTNRAGVEFVKGDVQEPKRKSRFDQA